MSDALVVFKAVAQDAEKQMLFQKLLAGDQPILLRDKFDRVIELKPLSINSNYQMKCRLPEDGLYVEENVVYSASFVVGNEKYLFETSTRVNDSFISLSILNLFHLQKRRNFRYVLPEGYPAQLTVTFLNQEQCEVPCRMLDLSTEGCAVVIEHEVTSLQLNDLIHAEIKLGARHPILVQGFIKNLRPTYGTDLVLGIEFNHLASSSEGSIVHAITDLQRELYFLKAG